MAHVTSVLAEFQRVDDDLLSFAVKDTNIKANDLAFGPAAAAIKEANAALARLVVSNAESSDAKEVMLLAFGAQKSALHLETLLPPHIAEESDEGMDELEASMAVDDVQVHKNLDGLAALQNLRRDPDLAIAGARYAEFTHTRKDILALSRENTDVRSLSTSLKERRKVTLACEAALGALQQAIAAEPTAGSRDRAPVGTR